MLLDHSDHHKQPKQLTNVTSFDIVSNMLQKPNMQPSKMHSKTLLYTKGSKGALIPLCWVKGW